MLTAVGGAGPPVFGAKVVKVDASETLKVPGVKGSGAGGGRRGGHRRAFFWPAKVGRDKLVVAWEFGTECRIVHRANAARFLRRQAKIARRGREKRLAIRMVH